MDQAGVTKMKLLKRLVAVSMLFLATILMFATTPVVAQDALEQTRVIAQHTQVVVELDYIAGRVAYSSNAVSVNRMAGDEAITVSGSRIGEATVQVWDRQNNLQSTIFVTVVPTNLAAVLSSVEVLLEEVEGIRFRVVNNRIYIMGEVSIEEELSEVDSLAEREDLVVSQVTLSNASQQIVAGIIEEEIGVPGVRANLLNGQIILEGVVHSAAAAARAEAIANALFRGGIVVNVLDVREVERVPGHAKTVTVLVHYVELAKQLTSTWGVEWTPLAVDGGVEFYFNRELNGGELASATGAASATVTSLLPRLNRARTSGYARVLENPTISVKSGETAEIFSGFEYPYLVSTGLQQSVEWKDVGIRMTVSPFAHGNDVDMSISVEVTSLGEVAPNGFQAINKAEISTTEYCRAGESIVIGGLQRVLTTVSYNTIPESSSMGALFNLYANRSFKKSKSQFLVFMTPKIHESSSSANQEIKDVFNLQEVRH